MKKRLQRFILMITLYLGLAFPCVYAQSISVKNFSLAENDMTAMDNPVLDQNGNKCALIRVQTTQKGFVFDVGSLGVRKVDDTKVGEVWVYVPAGVKHVDIRHQELGNAEQYYFPVSIQAARTYRLELDTKSPDVQVLNIKYSPANAVVVIDGDMIDCNNGVAQLSLPYGSHKYAVMANGYYQQEGTIELKSTAPGRLLVELESKDSHTENKSPHGTSTVPNFPQQTQDVSVEDKGEYIDVSVNGVAFRMIKVERGTFEMGSKKGDKDEKPVHSVTISKDYYIGETEVTQALWKAVTGYSPTASGSSWSSSYGVGDNYPAYYISYEDVQSFITKLNQMTGQKFRMPTEAEWEYAAKGGNKSKGYKYSGSNTIGDVAWYTVNAYDKGSSSPDYGTHIVKTKSPNELGIYDMSGNVWEWCSDWYASYGSSAVTDPTGTTSGSIRVTRGGSWYFNATRCRSAYRSYNTPTDRYHDIGFRLAL